MFKKFFQPWIELKVLPRELWILSGATLINRMGTMALPFLVLYLNRHLGFSIDHAGLMLGVYGASAFFTGPLAGRLSDRFHPVRVMKFTLLGSGLILILYPFAQTFTAVLLMTVLWAVMGEAFRPACIAYVAELAPAPHRKKAHALQRLAINLGTSVGPAMGGFLATVSFASVFWVDGVFSLGTSALLILFLRTPQSEQIQNSENNAAKWFHFSSLKDVRLLYALLALIPVTLVFFQHNSTLPLFMVENLKLSEAVYGLVFTINTLIIVFTEIPLNHYTAHWSHARTLALGSLFYGLGFGILFFAHDFFGVAVMTILITVGEMIFFPGIVAYLAEIAPDNKRGEYLGLFSMTMSFGLVVGPWGGTWLFEHMGSSVLWPLSFVMGLIATILFSQIRGAQPVFSVGKTISSVPETDASNRNP